MKFIWLLCGCVLLSACETGANPTPGATAAPTASAVPATVSAPSATLQVSAEAKDTVISLRWTAAPDARGYLIFRDGNAKPLNTAPISNLSYDDIGLTNGRTYTYSVAALDATGQISARSADLTATPKSK